MDDFQSKTIAPLDTITLDAINEIVERSKDDRAFIVGSEVRAMAIIAKAGVEAEVTISRLTTELAAMREALKPFAEEHAMGDNYVKFHPRLILAARAALANKVQG